MIKDDQGDGGVKVISHDVEAETALIKHGQTYIDVKMHQGPEGWTVFEFGNEMHTMDDLPSLAITGKHGPLVLHEPSTAMGSNDASPQPPAMPTHPQSTNWPAHSRAEGPASQPSCGQCGQSSPCSSKVMKKPSCLKRPGSSKPVGYGSDIFRAMWYTRGHIALRYKLKTGGEKQLASVSFKDRPLAWKIAQQAVGKLRAGTLDVADAKAFLRDNLLKK